MIAYSKILTVGLALTAFALSGLQAQTKPDHKGYRLVWSDEFERDGLPDTANWQYEKGFVRNHELQWYQPQNAYCKNGKLIIEAQKVHLPNPLYVPQSTDWRTSRQFIEYTSASLNTRHAHSWQYGRMEMRARIDTAAGLWPAFWTLGVKGQWPSNGEIDIMEYYRGMLLANIACGTATAYKAKWYSTDKPISALGGKEWSKKFHNWRMDWDENEISLYVDDIPLNRVALKNLMNQDGTGINPFKQPHYILLNLALGGDNGGDPSRTTFPRKYEIEYVKTYQKIN